MATATHGHRSGEQAGHHRDVTDTRDFSQANGPGVGGQYEFGPEHNRVIAGLAKTMTWFGGTLMIFGVVQLIFSLDARRADMPAPLVPGILGLMFGGLLIYSADAFRRIVTTQGNDVDHLMEAMGRLRFTFVLQLGVAVLAVAVAIFVMLLNRPA